MYNDINEKRHMTEGIDQPNQKKIRMHKEKETYKYLGNGHIQEVEIWPYEQMI